MLAGKVQQTRGYNFSMNGKKIQLVKPGTQTSIVVNNNRFDRICCFKTYLCNCSNIYRIDLQPYFAIIYIKVSSFVSIYV